MCGIFGWVLSKSARQSYETLVRITDLMRHRGPDGSGYWLNNTADGSHQIGLGHRRLSIIDIEGGAQPMSSSDGNIVVTFNGEIYNYIELRQELIARGHSFRTASDTEVLIEAWRAWGLDSIERLRGMFAFALWDSRTQRLVIARDHFGKKPVFFVRMPGVLVCGSEIEPLLQFPGVDRAFNHDALVHYLFNRYVPGPLTFFRSVEKLQPGCYALWENDRFVTKRYFTPPIASTEPDIRRFDDAVSQFQQTFDEAVRIRMRSDAPFGAYLSGGVDSAAVVATMVRHSSAPIQTFSIGFREELYSELKYARMVADRFATNHHEVVVDPEAFMADWSTAVLRRGAPVSEAADIPILMLSRSASHSVKMVLTGEGADELMGGYPKHRVEPWIGFYQKWWPELLHERVVGPMVRRLPYAMRRIKILATAAGERDFSDRMRVWFGGVSVAERHALIGDQELLVPPDSYPFSSRSDSPLRRALFFDQTSWLPDNLLERGDRMMMAASIEGRMPFMDIKLAALVARFPDEFLIGHRRGKAILRAAMRHELPPEILTRRKVGFRVPFDLWFREGYRTFLMDALMSKSSKISGLLNGVVVRRLVMEHVEGRTNHEKILWSLVNLELFLRMFKPTGIDPMQAAAA
jgi:asparagine synthase (glutamine-hydrolysing)